MIYKNLILSTLALTTCATLTHAQEAETETKAVATNAEGTSSAITAKQDTNQTPPAEEKINRIVYDVFVAKSLQGTVLVNYTDEWVQINNTDDVIQQMRDINNPSLFIPLLEGKIPSGRTRVQTGVGQVHVDTNNFALYIDVDQSQTLLKKLENTSEVTTDDTSWTGQNALRLNTSSDSASTESALYTLNHSTSISNGPWRLNFNGDVTNEDDYEVNQAVIELDNNAKRYSMGMLRTQGTGFVSSAPFYGLQVRDNYKQLNNLSDFESAPIEIYIPSRSKVTIFRDGTKLIYNETLDFGFQEITTSSFPSGSYDIRIKIEEQDGTVTEETQSFQKNRSLSAYDHPSYNFQFGVLRENFNIESGFIFQADYSKRIAGSTEATVSVYGNESLLAFEPQLRTSINDLYSVNARLHFTSNSDVAFKGSVYRRKPGSDLEWFATISQILAGHDEQAATSTIPYDDLTRLVSGSQSNVAAGISYNYKDLSLKFNARQNTSDNSSTIYAYGPSVLWHIYNNNGHKLSAEARLTYTNALNDTSLIANYRYIPQNSKITASANAGRIGVGGKYYNKSTQTFNYSDLNNYGSGYSVNVSNNYIQNNNSNSNSTQLNYVKRTDLLKLNATYETVAESTNGTRKQRERTDLTLTSNVIITKNGITTLEDGTSKLAPSTDTTKVLFTAKETLSSGMIIDLTGNATGAPVNILLNNSIIAKAKVGQRITINIPEYSKSIVSIIPRDGAGLLSFDSGDVEITLNPNTVFHKEWEFNNVTIAMGRLIDLNGEPLKKQKIEGLKENTFTDASGYFQMELLGTETPYLQNINKSCTLALPRVTTKELLNNLGDIVCG